MAAAAWDLMVIASLMAAAGVYQRLMSWKGSTVTDIPLCRDPLGLFENDP